MGLKGIVFTLDSIIAFGVMLFVLSFLIFFRAETSSPYLAAQQLHSMSEDILTVFSESTISEVASQSIISYYISEGILNETDVDKKTIDIIGALWSAGRSNEAANITKDILENFIPQNLGYELLIDSEAVYNSSDTTRLSVEDSTVAISSNRIASGYEKYKATEGYVARALAKNVEKSNTLIVMGDVVYSSISKKDEGTRCLGSNGNRINITYIIDVPEDANITDAYWFVESSWADDRFKVYLNGDFLYESSGNPEHGGRSLLTYDTLRDSLHTGRNVGVVEYRWGNPDENAGGGCEGGDDGATHFVVKYNTTQLTTLEQFDKQYFQTVTSESSIRYKKPIFIVGDLYNMSVRINLTEETEVEQLTLKFILDGQTFDISTKEPVNGIVEWSDAELKSNLSSYDIDYDELGGRYFWFMLDIDEYNRAELTDYIRYMEGDDSYVSLNYSEDEDIYNYIDLTRTLDEYTTAEPDLYGFYRYVKWDYNLTNKIPLLSKWQLAWLYYSGSNPEQLARSNNITLYNHDPSNSSSDPLIIEFVRFGHDTNPEGVLISGDNNFELNFSDGYAIDPQYSLGHTTFLIPASVSYGDIFEVQEDATNDAIQRLEDLLGEDVSTIDIVVESVSVAGVPYMWGPAQIKLKMWV
ncbi:MAG: hypothetical protein JW700_03515 [Candidatus Aenigmarchaeota archaeon]|nr:hypothetical protein [Candidatus Aenigmarchaeota archaeon]